MREGLIPDPKKKLLEAKKALGQRPGGAGPAIAAAWVAAAAGHGGRSRASFGGNIVPFVPAPEQIGGGGQRRLVAARLEYQSAL